MHQDRLPGPFSLLHGSHRLVLRAALGLWGGLAFAGVAQAAGVVTDCSTFGPGAGTLADALVGGGVVTFACSDTIVVPEIVVTVDTTLDATGQAVALSGGTANRVLSVSGARLELVNLTVMDGLAALQGGGVFADAGATVVLTDTTLSGNAAAWSGGGLAVAGGATATLARSVVSGNSARYGGGIFADAAATVALAGSTVAGNTVDYTGASGYGGGVFAWDGAVLTLTDTTVSGNSAAGLQPAGGGVYAAGEGTAVALRRSALSGNSARYGGGLRTIDGADAILENSTVSGNTATSWGGGIAITGSATTLALTHSTVSANSAVSGGGLFVESAAVTLAGSIVAEQAAGADCFDGGASTLTSGGHNIDSDVTCGLIAATDQPGTDPRLGPLAANGGPTETHALLGGSPALDRIPAGTGGCGTAVATDQRGTVRPQNGKCDSGAYEGSVAETELAANGSFEIDTGTDGKPDGWTTTNLTIASGEGRVCDTSADGDCSVRMDAGARANKLTQIIPYDGASGNRFTLTLSDMASEIAGATAYRISVKFFNGATAKKTVSLNLPIDTHGWTPRIRVFKGPALPYTSVKLVLLFTKTSGGGSVWLDDVSLRAHP